eukprot:TRINITY_DN19240_c0_g3_i1.p1 TRINITY_DN19240_c0_g3~~TRINITY_DN19240_c0_g3_i1.p1  ORF type:complete len:592 (+),score=147.08 TRINITY_DN19240_c0_g3_i1:90-1865(+)
MSYRDGDFHKLGWVPVQYLPAHSAWYKDAWELQSIRTSEQGIGYVYSPNCEYDECTLAALALDMPGVQRLLAHHRASSGQLATVVPFREGCSMEARRKERTAAARRSAELRRKGSGGEAAAALSAEWALPAFTEESLWRWAIEALRGLAALHRQGLVHGCVSADALALDAGGGLALSDAGIRPRNLHDPPAPQVTPEDDVRGLGAALTRYCADVVGGVDGFSGELRLLLEACGDFDEGCPCPADELLRWRPIAARLTVAHYVTETRQKAMHCAQLQQGAEARASAAKAQERAAADRESRVAAAEAATAQWQASFMQWHRGLAEWKAAVLHWRDEVERVAVERSIELPSFPVCSLAAPPLPLGYMGNTGAAVQCSPRQPSPRGSPRGGSTWGDDLSAAGSSLPGDSAPCHHDLPVGPSWSYESADPVAAEVAAEARRAIAAAAARGPECTGTIDVSEGTPSYTPDAAGSFGPPLASRSGPSAATAGASFGAHSTTPLTPRGSYAVIHPPLRPVRPSPQHTPPHWGGQMPHASTESRTAASSEELTVLRSYCTPPPRGRCSAGRSPPADDLGGSAQPRSAQRSGGARAPLSFA